MLRMTRRRYRSKPNRFVVAVRLALETSGFTYRKWGGEQRCKPGDWIVDNDGEVYTVDAEVFARTYRELRPGHYLKTTPIWAERAARAGDVPTKEGVSRYEAGDYIVANNEDGSDAYCMSAARFNSLYEPDE
jgi:hypothetical protein